MADDTPQKMIDAKKRKLQTQAFDDSFMAEMQAAEEKGDLPPARVRVDRYPGAEIVSSEVGGETPLEASRTRDKMIDARTSSIDAFESRFDPIFEYLTDAGVGPKGLGGGPELLTLVGTGKIRLGDAKIQQQAVGLYNDLISTPDPSGREPNMMARFGAGHKEDTYRERLQKRQADLEKEFPETRKEGPPAPGHRRVR